MAEFRDLPARSDNYTLSIMSQEMDGYDQELVESKKAFRHGKTSNTGESTQNSFCGKMTNYAVSLSVFPSSFFISFLARYLNGILVVSLSK